MVVNFWQKLPRPIIVAAPMAGVTDSPFRRLCKAHGADVVYTEMVSADALFHDSKKTLKLLAHHKSEHPIVCQLFGSHPETFPKACSIIEASGFDGIDLNFGCPAKKVVRQGSGVMLLKDLDKCYQIIETVIKSTKLPVSIKTRASIGEITVLDFLKKIKKLDVKALMLHGRSFEKPFSGEIDYALIKKAKKIFPGIVLANGGINTPEQAKSTLEKTGADGLGLARGLYGKPWLFSQIKTYLKTGNYTEKSILEIKKIILQHAKLVGPKNIVPFRKFLLLYTHAWPKAKALRQELVHVETLQDIKKVLCLF